jgi:hypothetical protein
VENFFSRFLKYSGDLSCYNHHEQNGSSLPFDLDEYPDWSIPLEGTREATRGGGGEWEPNKILLQELAYVPSSNRKAKTLQEGDEHTNQ